ncbi:protease modulator HflK [Marinomonas sp. NPDC078689]|uniref:protease modulator HflK n=1 Tax=Marinomonas sp. NPDC078689 TaxID=3364147 RepID=UPI0037CBF69C
MRVDIETQDIDLEAIPRFQLASTYKRQLQYGIIGFTLLTVLLLFIWLVIAIFAPLSIWLPLQLNIAAILLVLVAAFQSAWRISLWREQALAQQGAPHSSDPQSEAIEKDIEQDTSNVVQTFFHSFAQQWIKPIQSAISVNAIWIIGLTLFAFLLIATGWNLSLPAQALGKSAYLFAGITLLLAFALLVLERYLSSHQDKWPEASHLAMLVRVAIVTLILSAVCLSYASADRVWPLRMAVLSGLLPTVVALELIVRALLSAFTPQRQSLEPTFFANSFMAELFRWPPKPIQLMQEGLFQRFGIDLRQVWAFSFIKRASLPVLALIVFCAWLLTGVHEIPMNGRGIYEKFGKPVSILKSGLHTTLPWPFGRLVPVENGVIHELTASSNNNQLAPLTPAEGPAPETANRLWDATHRSEKSQIIASSNDGKQNFQIVDMDVRFIYRIGLTDQDALNAIYKSADLPTLIRRTANRILVHDFAGRTLDDLLSEQRNTLSNDVGQAVQHDLDQLHSGVELLATAIEAIHPPAKAANAYHKVQSSQIEVQALIAREKGKAAAALNKAHQQASLIDDQAQANAHQTMSKAQADKILFDADHSASKVAGQTFLREQYYQQLTQGMSQANSLIIDHRIHGNKSPTLDFRRFTAPIAPVSNTNTTH